MQTSELVKKDEQMQLYQVEEDLNNKDNGVFMSRKYRFDSCPLE